MLVVDGKPAPGPTPLSLEVPPGAHALSVRRAGYATQTRPFEARFGAAVLVAIELAREGN